jgi:undecaprenyl-diphosphatase
MGPAMTGASLAGRLAIAAMVGGAAATACLLVLAILLGHFASSWDPALLAAMGEIRSDAGDRVARQVTALGNALTLAALVAWTGLLLWASGRHTEAVVLAVAVVGGRGLTELLKALFGRPRPDVLEWGADVAASSFPSGHAMGATVTYGALAFLVARIRGGRNLAGVAWLAAAVLVLPVALSRVYLGVHYPTDAVAGIVAGVIWLIPVLYVTHFSTTREAA